MDGRSSTDSAGQADGDVIEIIPIDEYDSNKAKLRASMAWILDKAYREGIPKEFSEPFYQTPEGVLNVKPRLANLMVTSDLYCQACSNMFGESTSQWKGHSSIIQILSRKGIYVLEADDTAVTETTLMKTAPFRMTAHLALVDALMMAYTSEVVSIERVVQAVRKFATFNASSELPSDVHDSLMFWINKVCVTVQHYLDKKVKGQQLLQGDSQQKVRIVSRASKESVTVPVLEDFLADIGDGCSLATLVSFYCPEALKFEDICLKTNVGIADSLYNLQLVRGFCENNIPSRCFHLTYEDFLYTSNKLLPNFYTLMAELFYWLEVQKLDCVVGTPGQYFIEEEPRPTTAKLLTSAGIANLPISNATKQSFRKSAVDDSAVTPAGGMVNTVPHQPLLHKRHQQGESEVYHGRQVISFKGVRRSQSLKSPGEKETIRQSLIAWDNKQATRSTEHLPQTSESQKSGGNLLANVSIDSELNDSFNDDVMSMDFGDLSSDTPPPTLPSQPTDRSPSNLRNPNHPDYMELQSVASGATTTWHSHKDDIADQSSPQVVEHLHDHSGDTGKRSSRNLEPLFPARLKPAKEKSNNHSKAEERGEIKKPTSPPKTQTCKYEVAPESMTSSGISGISDTCSSTSSLRDLVTPLSEGQLSDREGSPRTTLQRPGYSAFTVDPKVPERMTRSCESIGEVKSSYTITDHSYTPETARAAGIPIVSDSNSNLYRRGSRDSSVGEGMVRMASREGSIASSRSSGDYSDHESHKIHCDHKDRESETPKKLTTFASQKSLSRSAEKIFNMQKPVIKTNSLDRPSKEQKKSSFTTSFAEIKRMKQMLENMNTENTGVVFMHQGQEPYDDEHRKSALKDTFQRSKDKGAIEKKTSFAPLPNQTTWQQTSQQSSDVATGGVENGDISTPVATELLQIKLKLEEKRKMIERKKHRMEAQQQKIRQRMGKTAFLHVVQKPPEGGNKDMVNGRIQEHPAEEQRQVPDTGRPSSLERDLQGHLSASAAAAARNPSRPFSREGIQQTIENVRKKWFQDDNLTGYKHRDSESPSRYATEDRARSEERRVQPAPEEAEPEDKASGEHPEDYNASLDKLNQSLSDLQGEIMRLSLQQEQMKFAKTSPSGQTGKVSIAGTQKEREEEQLRERVSASPPQQQQPRTATPPRKKDDRITVTPKPETKPSSTATSSAIGDMGVPTPERMVMGKGEPHYPQHPGLQQQPFQSQPAIGQQPLGQYVGMPPVSLHYAGYQPSPYPPHQFPPTPPHGFPQSPPYPSQYHHISPPYSVPPTTHPYGIGMSPFHPPPPVVSTYAVSSHPSLGGFTPGSSGVLVGVPTSHTGAQTYNPPADVSIPRQPVSSAASHIEEHLRTDKVQTATDVPKSQTDLCQEDTRSHESDDSGSVHSIGQNGFFVSFGDGSPKRNKPKLGKERAKKEQQGATPPSSQTNLIAPVLDVSKGGRAPSPRVEEPAKQQNVNDSGIHPDASAASNVSHVEVESSPAVGFVIADEELQEQVSEDDMQRKKEKILQLQLKRREDQERKRQYKELEMSRRKEQERQKQEEAERKKQEEKARRELIFRQYQEKKRLQEEEAEGGTPLPRREKTGHAKTRPKSMYAPKTSVAPEEGLHSNNSMEDLSAQAFTISPGHRGTSGISRRTTRGLAPPRGKMRKAVSCNTLTDSSDGKLAYGGLTHRRPPSPDLYNRGKRGKASTESSETGSNTGSHTGSDYAGPKLFVKPSSKSNRHIIINAISHCCLAGCVNSDLKSKVLEELAKSDAKHFVILFRDHSCQYRSLFEYYPETEDLVKIHGIGPKQLTNKMIEKFFKYNSGGKSFTEVASTKHISVSIDAVVIHNALWKTSSRTPKR